MAQAVGDEARDRAPGMAPEPAMSGVAEAFRQALSGLIVRIVPGARRIEGLRRLSAGATLETWSFDAVGDGGDGAVGSVDPPTHAGSGGGTAVIKVCHPLILRRSPGGLRSVESLSLETEADLIRALADSGAPVPTVVHTLVPPDGLGDGFLMTRIDGETIPRKILRDAAFADVRPRLTAQFGEILAAIHRVDTARLPALPVKTPASVLDRMQQRYEQQKRPSAVIDVGLHWLRANAPDEPRRRQLVHGDFRNGNLIVGAEGVRAVLDWEVAHLGDPAEDLAWICLPPWRFGEIDRPVGGLGSARGTVPRLRSCVRRAGRSRTRALLGGARQSALGDWLRGHVRVVRQRPRSVRRTRDDRAAGVRERTRPAARDRGKELRCWTSLAVKTSSTQSHACCATR